MYFFSKKQVHSLISHYISINKNLLNIDIEKNNKIINKKTLQDYTSLLFEYEEQIYKCINLFLYNIWYHVKDVEAICPNPHNWKQLMYFKRVNPIHIHCLKWTLYDKIFNKYHKYAHDE